MHKSPTSILKSAAVVLALLAAGPAVAQTKVATYAAGKPGTDQYEELSFWVKDGQRGAIYYVRGKERSELPANYLPRTGMANGSSFAIRMADDRLLNIIPSGNALKVASSANDAPITFVWKYEGPVNGVGTFCRECAASPKEAMQLLRTYYLK
ncbi:hypothetical protein MUN81_10605 [Hymenobacter sp. 5317J-9]|uniref:hypothetical protein n=1 Tax=Hymenobacter sp. 5317J-9 TaxID=2932250 RepID=UPI001FD636D6|nr:hypothetical protein [Hymenobacter sp. 5317J-9]UOQ99929.1 hypothetical protein MUN81_10605 [Hymenobacter sp. 5317J-9]